MVNATNRESSLSRNDIHLVYSAESTIVFKSRGRDSSCQLPNPSMRGDAADRNGQKAAAATPASTELANVKLRYKKPQSDTSELLQYPIDKGSVATLERLSPDFRFAASVAAFGQLLRGGKHVGNFGYGDVEKLARGGIGQDTDGYRREFLSLVQLADSLTPRVETKDMVSDVAR